MKISEKILSPFKLIFESNQEIEDQRGLTAEEVIEKIFSNLDKKRTGTRHKKNWKKEH
jgi:hypothetical protein